MAGECQVTNRRPQEKDCTAQNLRQMGFPDVSDETLLIRTDTTTTSKEARRQAIAQKHRVVLLIGDILNDLAQAFERQPVTERAAAVDAAQADFGTRFIVLPNAMYGDWESALYGYFGGAVSPNTYNGPNFQSVGGLTFNTPGTFDITHNIVTDCCGPSPVRQITLIVDALPVISAVNASPQTACQGGEVTLSVTGTAASFEWSPAGSVTPSTGTTVTANPTATTTYQVTAYSASGNCVETATITVTVLPPPAVLLMAVSSICTANGGVNTSVSGGSGNYSYAWDTNGDGNADVFTQNLSGLAVGQYTVSKRGRLWQITPSVLSVQSLNGISIV